MYLVVKVLGPQLPPQKEADSFDEDGVQLLHGAGIPRLMRSTMLDQDGSRTSKSALHVWPGFRVHWLPITKIAPQ